VETVTEAQTDSLDDKVGLRLLLGEVVKEGLADGLVLPCVLLEPV
jgi:hypothetical protein